jgi:hypothetical protein
MAILKGSSVCDTKMKITLDNRMEDTGNVYLEVAEKLKLTVM